MSGFSPFQLKKLTGKLDRAHVQSRNIEGRTIDYIEGWFALSEANAIFGFANWDRETVHFERLFERTRGEMTTCSYSARVRIRVRAGGAIVSREGTGCGMASARNAGDAHERAIKAAETDATKRALATFGNRFGLCLYDKEQTGVSEPNSRSLEIVCPDGQVFSASLSPEGFCTALRKIIESTTDTTELSAWHERNAPAITRLRTLAPELKTQRGEHYADVLERLFQARLPAPTPTDAGHGEKQSPSIAAEFSEALQSFPVAASRIAYGPRIDKAALSFKNGSAPARQGSLIQSGRTSLSRLRTATLACSPSALRSAAWPQPKGQRRVRGTAVLPASPRTAWGRLRARLVAQARA
jgi:DNA recombination protein Rad52